MGRVGCVATSCPSSRNAHSRGASVSVSAENQIPPGGCRRPAADTLKLARPYIDSPKRAAIRPHLPNRLRPLLRVVQRKSNSAAVATISDSPVPRETSPACACPCRQHSPAANRVQRGTRSFCRQVTTPRSRNQISQLDGGAPVAGHDHNGAGSPRSTKLVIK